MTIGHYSKEVPTILVFAQFFQLCTVFLEFE
jgi:hypothetical protein